MVGLWQIHVHCSGQELSEDSGLFDHCQLSRGNLTCSKPAMKKMFLCTLFPFRKEHKQRLLTLKVKFEYAFRGTHFRKGINTQARVFDSDRAALFRAFYRSPLVLHFN